MRKQYAWTYDKVLWAPLSLHVSGYNHHEPHTYTRHKSLRYGASKPSWMHKIYICAYHIGRQHHIGITFYIVPQYFLSLSVAIKHDQSKHQV
jgi:hypothetical protein